MDNNTQSLTPYKTRSLNGRCPTQLTQVSNQTVKLVVLINGNLKNVSAKWVISEERQT